MAQMELEWSFYHPLEEEWMELGTKGSIQEALIASGELPDPFYGENEAKFNWVENYIWELKSIFFLPDSVPYDQLELELPSVDTYADVYVNDTHVLRTQNAFLPYAVSIEKYIHKGMNEISIVLVPPVIRHKDKKAEIGYELPAPNDTHENAIAPYTRKPQYQFGWDWALRMNTIGLNKPAKINFLTAPRITNKSTRVVSVSEEKAVVEFIIFLNDTLNKSWVWQSELFGDETVDIIDGKLRRYVEVKNPELWWPRGQGEQFLYQEAFNLVSNTDQSIRVPGEFKFGIKTSELVQETDEWGTSYYFKINGRRIFAKGADYIPQEIFPAAVTDSAVTAMVETMAASNFNMVRVWGGGYYPDEVFFEKCDELGIMVWQDLMFACAMYPGDSAFLENITNEFEYQIPRIARHPSVVLFNGNNEVEVAWGNWGFQIKYGLYGKSAKDIEKAYDDIFKQIAPSVVEKYTDIPYVHTSPLSNWGKTELYNHGSQHYWGVWHGKDPIEDFGKKIGRFNAEYGFQSFPEYATIGSFADEKEWDLNSDIMKHHQKSYVGNQMILKHAKRLFGEPKDFEEFVYFSQLTQAMAVSMAVAGHRVDAPRCGGTLYWQLNDCWPAPTWSSIDYLGNWKALHYQMKKDYADVAVVATYQDLDNRSYYVVSDVPGRWLTDVTCTLYDLEGNMLETKAFSFEFENGGKEQLEVSDVLTKRPTDGNYMLLFKYKDQDGQHYYQQYENIQTAYNHASDDDVHVSIQKVDTATNTAEIKVSTTKFLRKCWISSNKAGVHFNKNFENMLPGDHTITIHFSQGPPNQEDLKLMWL